MRYGEIGRRHQSRPTSKTESKSEHKALKTEQRGWVKGRNDCWKSDDMRGCVAGEYHTRINELKDR